MTRHGDLNLPKGYLSHSQIECYLKCPQQYYEKYVEERGEDLSPNFVEGLALAAVMEETNLRYVMEGTHSTFERARKIYSDKFKDLGTDVVSWEGTPPEVRLPRGIKLLKKFWESPNLDNLKPVLFQQPTKKMVPGVELEFEIQIGHVPVKGFIDCIEKDCVIDFKMARSAAYYKPERSLQLAIYALATGIPKVAYYVFCKTKEPKIEYKEATLDLGKTERWVTRVVTDVAQGITLGMYPLCSPSQILCSEKYCSFWKHCVGGGNILRGSDD